MSGERRRFGVLAVRKRDDVITINFIDGGIYHRDGDCQWWVREDDGYRRANGGEVSIAESLT